MMQPETGYTSRLNFDLDPQMRADEATKIILRFLVGVMRYNEDGIRQDRDPEYLHDYRVAVRRTRSALGQIRGVFPAELTEHYREEFAVVGRWTNELRDMDVYLGAEKAYQSMLPSALRTEITPLFAQLQMKRGSAHLHVVEGLDSAEYAELMEAWETFLSQPPIDDPSAANATMPVVDLARRRIYKRYRRVVNTGRQLLVEASDDELHALRVDCKKLRYLMEFFASLFPRKQLKYLIKQLKKLQRNLGNFNDYRVQQAYLFELIDSWPADEPKTERLLLAVGSLVGTLEAQKNQERANFERSFTDFASSTNRGLFKELFKPS